MPASPASRAAVFTIGQTLRLISGTLHGMTGSLVRAQDNERLLIRMGTAGGAVYIEVAASQVECIG